jgi:L-lactate dehydrogenase complex protein LldG
MDAREEILGRVRRATADHPRLVPPPRDYRGPGDLVVSDPIALLTARLTDYGAGVRRCRTEDVAQAVAALLADRTVESILVPADLPRHWLEASAVRKVEDDPPLSPRELDRIDGVVTTCAIAVALTGTIVLDAGPGQGRRALSLVPDYHLVVLHPAQIVAGVPDAIAALDASRPLTWISGPSATSDIELQRVQGVHGPRRLDVLIVA